MNKFIRVFAYILMVLGALIVLGGFVSGIVMLGTRGFHMLEQSAPMLRMMGGFSGITTGLKLMLQGLLVSGFGMLLYLLGQIAEPKEPPAITKPEKTTRVKK
jgi:uncharacterized membrane protein